jgi:hypothetical protein
MKKDSKQTQLTPLENALQRQFNADAGNYQTLIKAAYERTTKIQSSNIAAIIGFGLLALSIKPQIGYGKFGDWLADTLGGALSKSAAYSWIKAAEWLVAKIAIADKQTDIVAERICQFAEKAGIKRSAEEIFADAETTSAFVSYVSEELPFRTFLNILKTANAAALEAEDEERKAKEKSALTKRDLKGLGGNGGGQQLDFFSELYNDFRATIEAPRSDRRFSEMPRAEMEQLGNYLIAQGREIVEIAKGKKD